MLQYQHRVAVGTEAVALFDGFVVGFHHEVVAAECRYHHEHGGVGQMEVGDERRGDGKIVGGEDEFVGPAFVDFEFAAHADCRRHAAEHGGAYGAYLFAKWLTDGENNLDFVTKAGYLPVTDEALDTLLHNVSIVEDKDYHSLYNAVDTMVQNYEMYALPLYDGASDVQLNFEKNVKTVLKSAHNEYLKRVNNGENPSTVLTELTYASLTELRGLSAQ